MDCERRNETEWPNHTLLAYTSPADGQGEGERGRLRGIRIVEARPGGDFRRAGVGQVQFERDGSFPGPQFGQDTAGSHSSHGFILLHLRLPPFARNTVATQRVAGRDRHKKQIGRAHV